MAVDARASGKYVLVTGGSGFIATWIVTQLLTKGYSVRTTIRRLEREPEVRAAVAKVAEAGDRLSFVAADLLSDAGWDRAAEGCAFAVHVASPMPAGEYRKQDVIRPAREGTRRVLESAGSCSPHR